MPLMKYWNGTSWVTLDANKATQVTDGTNTYTASNIKTIEDQVTTNSNQIVVLSYNYNTYSSNIDSNGIFTTVDYKRSDATLYLNSTLSGGTSPSYTTDTWTFYQADGTTVDHIVTWTLTYDSNGNVVSKVAS